MTVTAGLVVAGAVLAHAELTSDLEPDASRAGAAAFLAVLCWSVAAGLYLGAA